MGGEKECSGSASGFEGRGEKPEGARRFNKEKEAASGWIPAREKRDRAKGGGETRATWKQVPGEMGWPHLHGKKGASPRGR